MLRPSHWDIVSDDPARAIAFYQSIFGWKFEKWEGPMDYWMVDTGDDGAGINGGLGRRQTPDDRSCNVIDVPDIDEYVRRIVEGGGTMLVPKVPVPGVGWMAYFLDTEGNQFGLMQFDAEAK